VKGSAKLFSDLIKAHGDDPSRHTPSDIMVGYIIVLLVERRLYIRGVPDDALIVAEHVNGMIRDDRDTEHPQFESDVLRSLRSRPFHYCLSVVNGIQSGSFGAILTVSISYVVQSCINVRIHLVFRDSSSIESTNDTP
jgi:hypothetical protein